MRRNKRLTAALLIALAAGCRRAPKTTSAPDPASGVTLAAPAPSSATVTSPLDSGASTYTNEMQVQNLRDQAADLGIDRLARPTVMGGMDNNEPHRTVTYQEGVERIRAMASAVEAERHVIEGNTNKSVAIPTSTPGVITGNKEGEPIENAPDGAGPKDPKIP